MIQILIAYNFTISCIFMNSPGPGIPQVDPLTPPLQMGLINNNNNNNSVLDNTDPKKLELLEAIMRRDPTPQQDSNPATQTYSLVQTYPAQLSQSSQNEQSMSQHSNSSGMNKSSQGML